MSLLASTTNSPATDETGRHAENKSSDAGTHRLNKITAPKARFSTSDNPLHHRLFSLPLVAPTTSTALAIPTLPKKQRVTGDKEIDAVLWLHEVIATGDAVLIAHAQAAVKKIRTPLEKLKERYTEHLRVANPGNIFAALSSIGFGDLEQLAEQSIKRRSLEVEALGRFGSIDALFEETPAERFCVSTLKGLKRNEMLHQFDKDEAADRFRRHPAELPHTLADCLSELAYWDHLATLRYAFGVAAGDPSCDVDARNDFVFGLLAEIPPHDRSEARSVLDYLYSTERMDRFETRPILANLIG